MTPREKAIELVGRFAKIGLEEFVDENGLWDYSYRIEDEDAKQCALICVDEILGIRAYLLLNSTLEDEIRYWQEVKQEIEKL